MKILKIDKIEVAAEGRVGLVGGVALVYHTEGQHLPIGKSAVGEEVYKVFCPFAEAT